MAKNNSLTYIKRFLLTFPNVEVIECINSSYFNIDGVRVRISNHSKKQTKVNNKYDLSVIQPVNDDKQYIVIIKSSLAMLILDLKGVKEFIRNYIFIQQMNKFEIPLHNEDVLTKDEKKEIIKDKVLDRIKDNTKLKSLKSDALGMYLSSFYKEWYNDSKITKLGRKLIRDTLFSKNFTINEMNLYLKETFVKRMNDYPKSKYSQTDIKELLK